MTDTSHQAPSTAAPLSPRVVVLMSTYNGKCYVAEQLASILQQLPLGGRVIVRDDGSHDGTAAYIEALGDSRITVVQGTNLGFGGSFLTLLTMVSAEADLVMFSDQDDVWLPGKIDRAWHHLRPVGEVPALYGSAQMLVDQALRPLHATAPWPRGPSFTNALTENIITGCTAALNKPAVLLLQQAGVPSGVRFHDWWMYLVVSAFGRVIQDDVPTLLYRQHGGNHIGHGAGWWGRQRQIIRFLLKNDWVGILLGQVHAFATHYEKQLPPEARVLLSPHFFIAVDRAHPRWRLVFGIKRWRQSLFSEAAFRLLVALHRLCIWPLPGRRRRPW